MRHTSPRRLAASVAGLAGLLAAPPLALVIALVIAPLPAAAQEAIATAAGAPYGGAPLASPLQTSPMDDTLRLSDHLDHGPDVLRPRGPCGGPAKTEDGKTDKTPHGAVWAGVGTNGYRDVGGAVCLPVGDNTAVSIAVDAGQMNGWGRRR